MHRRLWLLTSLLVVLVLGERAHSQPTPGVDLHGDPLPAGAIAQIGSLRFRQWGRATSVAWSPNGRYLALGCLNSGSGSSLAIFEARTGKVVRRLPGYAQVVRPIAFSPDSKLLAYSGEIATLSVREVLSGDLVCQVENLGSNTIAVLADGRTLAADEDGKNIRLLDVRTGKRGLLLRGHTDAGRCISAAPDGKRLASCSTDGTVRVWDVSSGKTLHRFQLPKECGLAVTFLRDGRLLACGISTGDVYLWELTTGKQRWRVRLGDDEVSSLAVSADGSELYILGQQLRIWDTATGKERRHFKMPAEMFDLALGPDGKIVAIIGNDGELRRFDPARGQWLKNPDGHARGVCSVSFSPDGKVLATASGEAVFRLWDAATGRVRQTFAGWAAAVAFAPDGRSLASVVPGGPVSLWEVASGRRARRLPVESTVSEPSRVAFTAGPSSLVACCDLGDRVHFWDAATGKPQSHSFPPNRDLEDLRPRLGSFALAPDGRTLAVGSPLAGYVPERDEPIALWDIRTGKELPRATILAAPRAFSGDGRLLVAQTEDAVVLLNARTLKEVRRIQEPILSIHDVVFSPDGRMLADASRDGTVRLWETASGQERHCFRGHGHTVLSVAFSADGRRLASGSADMTALIWDVYGTAARKVRPKRTADQLWAELADARADHAFAALRALVAAPEQAIALARQRLRPAVATDPKRVPALLADLNSERFRTREKARIELEKAGPEAIALLERAAKAGGHSLECRRRLELMLDRLRFWERTPEGLRVLRLIEALERIGSTPARRVLRDLAKGDASMPQTEAARSALSRLK